MINKLEGIFVVKLFDVNLREKENKILEGKKSSRNFFFGVSLKNQILSMKSTKKNILSVCGMIIKI